MFRISIWSWIFSKLLNFLFKFCVLKWTWSCSPWQLLDVHSNSGLSGYRCWRCPPAREAIHTPSCHCPHWPGTVHLGTTSAHTPPASDQSAWRCDGLPPSRHDGGCVLIWSHWGGWKEETLHLSSTKAKHWKLFIQKSDEGATVPGKDMVIPAQATNSCRMAGHAA